MHVKLFSADIVQDGVAPWKLELLGPLGFVSEDHTVTLSASGAISQDLSYVARVLCALTQDEVMIYDWIYSDVECSCSLH